LRALQRRVAGRAGSADRTDLAGRHVVVTAGGTREPIDPVRFIGNRSSGKQGYAFARTAVARGARVTLISANVALPDPAGAWIVRVGSTEELRKATLEAAAGADAVVMAAAPADFRPARYQPYKIKKSDAPPAVELAANPDIAAELGARKPPGQVLVVFAAETAEPATALANAREKLRRKRADLIVLNEVGTDKTFGADRNAAVVLDTEGRHTDLGERPKEGIADAVWDLVVTAWTVGNQTVHQPSIDPP
jgi:phosphopantothenoylcysteine decarboxylase/phosphopantothenate--cysteine ligase